MINRLLLTVKNRSNRQSSRMFSALNVPEPEYTVRETPITVMIVETPTDTRDVTEQVRHIVRMGGALTAGKLVTPVAEPERFPVGDVTELC